MSSAKSATNSFQTQEAAYDAMPYASHCYHDSMPSRLAGAAILFGLKPPPLRTARVLEMGCAGGGNLIPHAAFFPEASFLGVDISSRQIEQGQRRIAAAGLKNIELRQCSITDLGPQDGEFDYIIAHGIYSWVPAGVRKAMFDFAGQALSANGIFYNSYNTYPGWHIKKIARDLMLFFSRGCDDPRTKMEAARKALSTLTHNSGSRAYQIAVREEAQFVAGVQDDYLSHDHCEDVNEPSYFSELAAEARRVGLTYLAETDLNMAGTQLPREVDGHLSTLMAEGDRAECEQAFDYIIGRVFRMSTFVRAAASENIAKGISAANLPALHFRLRAPVLESAKPSIREPLQIVEQTVDFQIGTATVQVGLAAQIEVLRYLSRRVAVGNSSTGESNLSTFDLDELVRATASTGDSEARRRELLSDVILELLSNRTLYVYSDPIRWGARSARPRVFPLIRSDAAAGFEFTANIIHEPVQLMTPETRTVVSLLDGTRDESALIAELLQRFHAGTFRLYDGKRELRLGENTDAAVLAAVRDRLAFYERVYMLMPTED